MRRDNVQAGATVKVLPVVPEYSTTTEAMQSASSFTTKRSGSRRRRAWPAGSRSFQSEISSNPQQCSEHQI